jgi:4-diphosphocytidyl-2-C-methyl-D-erythritol kinase
MEQVESHESFFVLGSWFVVRFLVLGSWSVLGSWFSARTLWVPPRARPRSARFFRMSSRRVVVRAHAKVNLSLRLLGVRRDGFHELKTVFQSLELHDTLTFVTRPGPLLIECATPGVPLDDRNLVWRAAAALWRAIGREAEPRDLAVSIEKAIPPQAGLGGGSADAAATLVALARLWGAPAAEVDLPRLAAGLGADVPFFLSGGSVRGLGRGDVLQPLPDLPRLWLLLVIPAFGVSTADAYGWYDAMIARGERVSGEASPLRAPWPSEVREIANDLEPPVVRHHPEIAVIKSQLLAAGATSAALSGSGSAVFGILPSRRAAARARAQMAGAGWRTLITSTLDRGEYARRTAPASRLAMLSWLRG